MINRSATLWKLRATVYSVDVLTDSLHRQTDRQDYYSATLCIDIAFNKVKWLLRESRYLFGASAWIRAAKRNPASGVESGPCAKSGHYETPLSVGASVIGLFVGVNWR